MTSHPDILELELTRTDEARTSTVRHLATCAECQAQMAALEDLGDGLGASPADLPIPAPIDARIREAIDEAVERAQAAPPTDEATASSEADDETGTTALRPTLLRRALPAIGAAAAVAATFVGILSFAGDNIRSLFGASADAIAGNESRMVLGIEGHKALSDFSGYAPEAPEPAASVRVTGIPAARASRTYDLVFEPGPGFTGILKVVLHIPEPLSLEALESKQAGDAVRQISLRSRAGGARVQLEIRRQEASAFPIQVLVRMETDEGGAAPEPSIARAEIITAAGVQAVSPGFERR